MSSKPLSVPVKILSQSILSTDMSFIPNNIVGWTGDDIAAADLGSQAFGAFLSADRTKLELFEFNPTTVASASITILKRGLDFSGLQTEVTDNKLDWTANETYILLGTDTPQFMLQLAGLSNDNIFTGSNTFPIATAAGNPVRLDQFQAAIIQGALDASLVIKGVSQLTAAPSKSLGNPTISIASPAVITLASHGLVANSNVQFTTSGTLPTGISAGTTYYVLSMGLTTNTFEISLAQGGTAITTTGVQSGTHTLLDVTPRAVGEQDTKVPTQPENDALSGTASPAPSTTNIYLKKSDIGVPATISGATISFTAATKTIADSGSGFVTAGFAVAQQVIVIGSGSNNGTYTIVSVAAGAIVVVEALIDEAAGASVSITGILANKLAIYSPASVPPGNNFSLLAGSALTAGQSLHLTKYYQSDGGTLLDNQSTTDYAAVTNQSKSFTVASHSNKLLLIGVTASSAPTLVQYAGVTATLIDSQSDGTRTLYSYYLVAPATGTANISVTGTGIYAISGAAYYNAAQSAPATSAKATNGDVTVSLSIATGVQCGFVHLFGYEQSTTGTPASADTTYTSKYISSQSGVTVIGASGQNFGFQTSISEFHDNFTTSLIATVTGGTGTVKTTAIAIVISPFTTPIAAVIPTDSSAITNNEPKINFVGFAVANTSKDALATVAFGLVSGLTLNAGYYYYLSDTPGTIATSPGTYGRSVGLAVTSTKLNMALAYEAKSQLTAQSKTTGFTYTAECDGFLIGRAGQNSTVTISSSSAQAGATASYLTPLTYPIGKGQTYVFTLTGSNGTCIFVPFI